VRGLSKWEWSVCLFDWIALEHVKNSLLDHIIIVKQLFDDGKHDLFILSHAGFALKG